MILAIHPEYISGLEAVASQAAILCDESNIAELASSMMSAEDHAKMAEKSYVVRGGIATIRVTGVLIAKKNVMYEMMGYDHTSYESIQDNVIAADADDEVDTMILEIRSPGGEYFGLSDCIDVIRSSGKRIESHVTMAASAAYGIAAASSKITATSRSSVVGSVGVIQTFHVDKDVVEITSRGAPNKRHDVTSAEGVESVKNEMQQLEDLFVTDIAAGRGITNDVVLSDFGGGALKLPEQALKSNMIDEIGVTIESAKEAQASPGNTAGAELGAHMNKTELMASHPELFALVSQEAKDVERLRADSHLMMAVAAGVADEGHRAIKEGKTIEEMTPIYMAASFSRNVREASAADSGDMPTEATKTETVAKDVESFEDGVICALESLMGVK